jgi:DNA-directed RNA polymerase specialized sigma24 family protein
MTQVPVGTVMSRLARARTLLLRALAPEMPGKTAS